MRIKRRLKNKYLKKIVVIIYGGFGIGNYPTQRSQRCVASPRFYKEMKKKYLKHLIMLIKVEIMQRINCVIYQNLMLKVNQ